MARSTRGSAAMRITAATRSSSGAAKRSQRVPIGTRWERFAAPDDERVAAVMRMAADPRVDLAIAARGGYGWSRLLDRLDFPAIVASRTLWLGHSDFTAFQLAALAR